MKVSNHEKRIFSVPSSLLGYGKGLAGRCSGWLGRSRHAGAAGYGIRDVAGLPPVYGLCAATLPLWLMRFWHSRQLAVTGGHCFPVDGDACSCLLTLALTLPRSLLQRASGFAGRRHPGRPRLVPGWLFVNFVSHAVVSGFTSAGAIMIGLSSCRSCWEEDVWWKFGRGHVGGGGSQGCDVHG